ncbi:MAG: hypothetical protein GF331_10415 [Chitinivibrionales bacterium]|nr:hypothetical protein [Chitinivibrionales bacterium]
MEAAAQVVRTGHVSGAGDGFDILQAAAADFEERRRKLISFIMPVSVRSREKAVTVRRVRRVMFKGGLNRAGGGKRLIAAGRIRMEEI